MKPLIAALALCLTAAQAAPHRLEIVGRIAPSQGLRSTEKARSAYLLAYFKDETHSLHFAVSADGYTFSDVNNGDPVLDGSAVAEQKGLRDPHIMRGPDGAFYLAMTDLHIFAQREGLRTTQWQRDGDTYAGATTAR